MYLNLLCKNEDIKYNITLNNILTVIVGDSSTGKTKLTDIILKNDYVKMETDAKEVVVYSSINVIKYLPSNSIVLVDSDTVRLDDVIQISKLCRDDLYILYLGRKYLKNLPLSVYSMYSFKIVHGITKNIEIPFKMYPLPSRTYDEDESMEHLQDYIRTNYIETSRWIYATYWNAESSLRVFLFDKQNKTYQIGKKMVNDMDGFKFIAISSACDDNCFVFATAQKDEESNPMIQILHLK